MRPIKFSQQGFTLISTVAVALFLGVIMMGTFYVVNRVTHEDRELSSDYDVTSFLHTLQKIFEKEESCRLTGLVGLTFPDLKKPSEVAVVVRLPTKGGMGPVYAEEGGNVGPKKTVERLRFDHLMPTLDVGKGVKEYLSRLSIRTTNSGKNFLTRDNELFLNLQIDSHQRVVSCGGNSKGVDASRQVASTGGENLPKGAVILVQGETCEGLEELKTVQLGSLLFPDLAPLSLQCDHPSLSAKMREVCREVKNLPEGLSRAYRNLANQNLSGYRLCRFKE